MRYIRTENGIYELKDNMSIDYAVYWLFGELKKTNKEHLFRNDKDLGEVVKQSDSMDELCDRFVLKNCDIIFLNKKHTQYRFEESDKWYGITDVEIRTGICGAIWTDAGLIYVVKMNDEREFEQI